MIQWSFIQYFLAERKKKRKWNCFERIQMFCHFTFGPGKSEFRLKNCVKPIFQMKSLSIPISHSHFLSVNTDLSLIKRCCSTIAYAFSHYPLHWHIWFYVLEKYPIRLTWKPSHSVQNFNLSFSLESWPLPPLCQTVICIRKKLKMSSKNIPLIETGGGCLNAQGVMFSINVARLKRRITSQIHLLRIPTILIR